MSKEGRVVKRLRDDFHKELGRVKAESRSFEALLKYVCWVWINDTVLVSEAVKGIEDKLGDLTVPGDAFEREIFGEVEGILNSLRMKFGDDALGLLSLIGDGGVSVPVDQSVMEVVAQVLKLRVELGANGVLLTVERKKPALANVEEVEIAPKDLN